MNKKAVHHITDTLGADAICSALDVSHHSIRFARTVGYFHGSWFGPLSDMCESIGIPCPKSAFKWRSNAKDIGNDCTALQEVSGKPAKKDRSAGAALVAGEDAA